MDGGQISKGTQSSLCLKRTIITQFVQTNNDIPLSDLVITNYIGAVRGIKQVDSQNNTQ